MTYLEKYNLAQHKNPCFEYSAEQIKSINNGASIDALEPTRITRSELNARKANLYYVKFNDGLKLNSEPVTLKQAKQLVKDWDIFKGLSIEMI